MNLKMECCCETSRYPFNWNSATSPVSAPAVNDAKARLGGRSPYCWLPNLRPWAASIDGRRLMTDETPPQRWNLSTLRQRTCKYLDLAWPEVWVMSIHVGPFELSTRYGVPVKPMRRKVSTRTGSRVGARRAIEHGYAGDDKVDAIVLT